MNIVSKNIFWLSFSRVAAMVLLLFAYAAQRKYLGPFQAGQYDFILAFVLLFAIVSDFGIQNFITKKISEDEKSVKKYFLQFLFFEIVLVTVLYSSLAAVAYIRHFEPVVFYGILIAGLGMAVNALCYPFLAVMTAAQDLRKVAFLNFVNSMVNIAVTAYVIIFHKGILALAGIQLTFGLIDLALYGIFARKHLPGRIFSGVNPKEVFHLNIIWSIIKYGWPFMLLVGFSAIYNRIDVVIITKFLGFEKTALYTTAYKYFDILAFFPATVSHVLYPFMAGLAARGAVGDIRQTLEKYLRIMLLSALPLAVGGSILSKKLILLVSDSRYLDGSPALSILIWAIAILYVYIPVNALAISQLTKKAAAVTGANVAINIVGNILLIPYFGILAAAAMTVVSEALQGIFYFYFVRKNITSFHFARFVYKPLLASAVMGAILWPVRDYPLFVALPVGVAVYAFVLLLTKAVAKSDLSAVRELF